MELVELHEYQDDAGEDGRGCDEHQQLQTHDGISRLYGIWHIANALQQDAAQGTSHGGTKLYGQGLGREYNGLSTLAGLELAVVAGISQHNGTRYANKGITNAEQGGTNAEYIAAGTREGCEEEHSQEAADKAQERKDIGVSAVNQIYQLRECGKGNQLCTEGNSTVDNEPALIVYDILVVVKGKAEIQINGKLLHNGQGNDNQQLVIVTDELQGLARLDAFLGLDNNMLSGEQEADEGTDIEYDCDNQSETEIAVSHGATHVYAQEGDNHQAEGVDGGSTKHGEKTRNNGHGVTNLGITGEGWNHGPEWHIHQSVGHTPENIGDGTPYINHGALQEAVRIQEQ